MRFPNNLAPQHTWRLDPLLLSSNKFIKFINDQIDIYLDINSTPGMSYISIWESLKAYLRGLIISAFEKRKQTKCISELHTQISDIDNRFSTDSKNLNYIRNSYCCRLNMTICQSDIRNSFYLKSFIV